jgi:hypothetical protein
VAASAAASAAAAAGRRHELRRQHVHLEHPPPVVGLAVLDAIGAPRTAGDVDEGVHVAGGCEVLRERGDVGLSVRSAANDAEPTSASRASSRSARRATPTTSQPVARSARTVASPIPELAPVTTARLFCVAGVVMSHATRPGRADCDVTFPDRC